MPGAAILKILNRKNAQFILSDYVLLIPLTGASALMIASQFSSLLLTMNQFALLYPILFLFCIYILRNNIVYGCKKLILNYKTECIIIFLIIAFLLYPVFYKQELATYQFVNDDGIFYLGSLNWLKDNSILDASTFNGPPMYGLAIHLFKITRFGLDTFGAFFAALFNKESHQMLSVLGAATGAMSVAAIAYFFKSAFKMPKLPQMIGLCVIGFNFGWVDLMIKQYFPQIMGLGCLVVFIFLFLGFFQS